MPQLQYGIAVRVELAAVISARHFIQPGLVLPMSQFTVSIGGSGAHAGWQQTGRLRLQHQADVADVVL